MDIVINYIEDKHMLYCRKDCMKEFCESLREHTKSIIDFEKKIILLLTKKELESPEDAIVCYICGISSLKNSLEIKTLKKLEIIIITQLNIERNSYYL